MQYLTVDEVIEELEKLRSIYGGDIGCKVAIGRNVADVEVVERVYDNMCGQHVIVIGDKV